MDRPADVKAVLQVRVVPNAKRSEIVGVYGEAIKVKVQAPPVDGKANEALREFLAGCLHVPARDIEIVGGGKSRDKMIAIAGLEMAEARDRLLTPK